MTRDDLIGLMFRASQAEVGFLLRVSDPRRALAAFARAREDASGSDELVSLPPVRFRELRGHPEGNLAILRGGVEGFGASRAKPTSEATSQEEELW